MNEKTSAAAPSPDGKAEQAEAPSDRGAVEHLCKWLCAWDGTDPMQLLDINPSKYAWQRHEVKAARLLQELAALATQPTASPEQAEAPSDWRDTIQGAIDELPYQHYLIPRLVQLLSTKPTASNAGEREWLLAEALSEYVSASKRDGTTASATYIKACAALATKPPAGEQKPVEWGSPTTVEKLIRQLQTFDPATPITSAVHTDYKGKRTALTMPLTMSRERVAGRFIRQGDESVPYSLVIWAQRDELALPPEQVAQDREDAENYRWLCSHMIVPAPSLWDNGVGFVTPALPRKSGAMTKPELDEAIRAARARGEGQS